MIFEKNTRGDHMIFSKMNIFFVEKITRGDPLKIEKVEKMTSKIAQK